MKVKKKGTEALLLEKSLLQQVMGSMLT